MTTQHTPETTVKRYAIDCHRVDYMEYPEGEVVMYEDYEKLKQQRDELRHLLIAMASEYLAVKDWHRLTVRQTEIQHRLVVAGILYPAMGGFVGGVITKAQGVQS
jgi:hypothetical protein